MVEPTMDPVVWLRKHLDQADTDLLREMVATFIQTLMSADTNDEGHVTFRPSFIDHVRGRYFVVRPTVGRNRSRWWKCSVFYRPEVFRFQPATTPCGTPSPRPSGAMLASLEATRQKPTPRTASTFNFPPVPASFFRSRLIAERTGELSPR